MRHQHRSGTDVELAAAQISALIDSISRTVQSLNYDIESEERFTRCWDCRAPAYSSVARNLSARRDNLAATVAALQTRLMNIGVSIPAPAGGEAVTGGNAR